MLKKCYTAIMFKVNSHAESHFPILK